ncbi:MAG: PAS domain S-box protein [Candidatus Nitrohelix vancouverensis]|uniref:histidine kinase n=1 Tax=Candidatus Nitrohelix vancouverensis TaxID=2705534 RepID=A0A7T0G2B5_9BACT|nr:MAG: PAS domain S-box protein [Candidatus Nitrohelix vancouverensis]
MTDPLYDDENNTYRLLFHALDEPILILNCEASRFVDANPAATRLYGYSQDEFLKLNVSAIAEALTTSLNATPDAPTTRPNEITQQTHRKKDGSQFPCEVKTGSLSVNKSKPVFAIIRDLTSHPQTDIVRLNESQIHLQSIINNSGSTIYLKDIQGRYILVSKLTEYYVQKTNEELRGKTDYEVFPKHVADAFTKHDREVLESQTVMEFEEVAPHPDGLFTFLSIKFPLWDPEGNIYGVGGISINISDRKKAQQELENYRSQLEELVQQRSQELQNTHRQLLHSEKLAALGKLSGTIAHELNNPIYGIRNIFEAMGEDELGPRYEHYARLGVGECDRISNLVQRLQDFYQPTSQIKKSLDLHAILQDMSFLLDKELRQSNIQIIERFANDLPNIIGVEDQLKQVVLNLIQNAKEAIGPDGGAITLSTRHDKDTVALTIQDSGAGIHPDHIDKIFDPFFTTKNAIKGTGLGLSVSYGIIKNHGAEITVQSDPENGTTFTVLFKSLETT